MRIWLGIQKPSSAQQGNMHNAGITLKEWQECKKGKYNLYEEEHSNYIIRAKIIEMI